MIRRILGQFVFVERVVTLCLTPNLILYWFQRKFEYVSVNRVDTEDCDPPQILPLRLGRSGVLMRRTETCLDLETRLRVRRSTQTCGSREYSNRGIKSVRRGIDTRSDGQKTFFTRRGDGVELELDRKEQRGYRLIRWVSPETPWKESSVSLWCINSGKGVSLWEMEGLLPRVGIISIVS